MDLGLKQLHSAFASGGSSGRSPPAGAHGAAAPCPGAARRPAAPVTAAHGRRPSNPSLPSAASSKPTNSCSYTRPRAALCPPPCSTAAPGSNPTSPVTSPPTLPPIPAALLQDEASARASWIDRCLNNPLTDPTTNSRIHIYGIPHFAPYGGPKGLHELQQLLTAVQPTILAIEQPYDVAARAGLPYPETVRQLLSLLPPPTDNDALADPALAEAVLAQLPQLSRPARVGRDMLDPFEVLGLYPGLDVAVRGEQLAEAGRRFGFVPGLEYAALVAAAEDAGAQVYSVDAPLKLQEQWVAQLVSEWTLGEQHLARQLGAELQEARQLLPAQFNDWDMKLAEAVQQLEQQHQQQPHGGGQQGPWAGREEYGGSSLAAITAFKVSRATAAATVPYSECRTAYQRQAGLQPLRWALFERRARHAALQVRDLCQRMVVRKVRVDAEEVVPPGASTTSTSTSTTATTSSQQRQPVVAPALDDASRQQPQVVLLAVGRQLVPLLEDAWANDRSAVWHGEVPRGFAPSSLPEYPADMGAAGRGPAGTGSK